MGCKHLWGDDFMRTNVMSPRRAKIRRMQLTMKVGDPCGLRHQYLTLAWKQLRITPLAAIAETDS